MFYFGLTIALVPFLAFTFLKLYTKLTTGWCKSHTCLAGKTAIITGANTGVGYETSLEFAKRGARLILVCLHPKKAEDAHIKVVNETDNNNVVFKLLDLNSSFESVRAFAEDIIENQIYRIRKICFAINVYLYGRTCEKGAQTILHCALAKGIEHESGSYFAECKNDNFDMMTKDPGLPKKLWEKTEEIVNLKPEEIQL